MTKIILLVIAFLVLPPVAKTTSEVYHDEILPKIEIDNLVTNGDFSDGTTGWTIIPQAELNVISDIGIITGLGTERYIIVAQSVLNLTDIYYTKVKVRVTDNLATNIQIGQSGTTEGIITITNPIQNEWYIINGSQSLATTENYSIRSNYLSDLDQHSGQLEIDYSMLFNLTALFDVTETSGTAYNKAVADIDNLIATHGYFDHLSIDLPPNYNVDLSRLGSQIINGIRQDVIKFVQNGVCIASGVAKTITIGAIKEPDFCPTIIPPLPWIHQNYMKLLEWLKG